MEADHERSTSTKLGRLQCDTALHEQDYLMQPPCFCNLAIITSRTFASLQIVFLPSYAFPGATIWAAASRTAWFFLHLFFLLHILVLHHLLPHPHMRSAVAVKCGLDQRAQPWQLSEKVKDAQAAESAHYRSGNTRCAQLQQC